MLHSKSDVRHCFEERRQKKYRLINFFYFSTIEKIYKLGIISTNEEYSNKDWGHLLPMSTEQGKSRLAGLLGTMFLARGQAVSIMPGCILSAM